ncbi:MAG: phage-shock protein [Deltaproteobacteria bacterium]|nr:phage-shock protein [Deltaproteobacteria bacterium]
MSTVLFFTTVLVIVSGIIVIKILKTVRGDADSQSPENRAEEVRLMQELNQSLMRMEQRVEALETIVLDREKRNDQP